VAPRTSTDATPASCTLILLPRAADRPFVNPPKSPPPDGVNPNAPYYPALDGLRGVAVLMVFFGHYAAFHPGWMGVSIFFVLSGFLITGILYDARDHQHRLRNFYVRRLLRIFPAYYTVWIALLLLTPFLHIVWKPATLLWPLYLGNWIPLLSPDSDFQMIAYPFHRIVNGVANITRITTGHFWTLCVEEQFYLIWPLVVFSVRKKSTLLRICAITIVVTPLLRIAFDHILAPSNISAWSYATFLRFDEFLLGGFAALLLRSIRARQIRSAGPYLFWGAAALLAVAAVYSQYVLRLPSNFVNTESWVMSWGLTLADVLGLGLVLMCLDERTWAAKVLQIAPLRRLGKISYGFYIFHELPHALYEHVIRATHLSPRSAGLLIPFAGTLALALASYHLIERPFLKLKTRFEGGRSSRRSPNAQTSHPAA
jgi:peptidoglycan/LPS O-acetylase OafA/YrhL